jgi:hypothetical protein
MFIIEVCPFTRSRTDHTEYLSRRVLGYLATTDRPQLSDLDLNSHHNRIKKSTASDQSLFSKY